MINPFLESAGGNCHDTVIAVELRTIKEKLLGACDGAANRCDREKFIIIDKIDRRKVTEPM